MAIITAQDGSGDSTTPREIDGFDPGAESLNVIHSLIGGGLAVTLIGDDLRTGQLRCLYDDDAEAEAARLLFKRPTSFTLAAPERPVVNLSFVRTGRIGTAMHDELRDLWYFTVGFQEIES